MNLHENKELFADAIVAASQPKVNGGLGIKQVFIEKDYWISRSLLLLSESDDVDLAVFKGGTSISKAYGLGYRFSEDIDIAITEDVSRSENQTKSLLSRISKTMSKGLVEEQLPNTRKYSKYRKVYFKYPVIQNVNTVGAIKPGQIQLELVSFANPYPFHKVEIGCLLLDFLIQNGRVDIAQEYGLRKFKVNVLDVKRTATEKIVSLLRHSLANDYIPELKSKIRHFYDLYFLWQNKECKAYIQSDEFKRDFNNLFAEDQARFKEPLGWQERGVEDSPLLIDFENVWAELKSVYESELHELAYQSIPEPSQIMKIFKEFIKQF
ncbi:MAG: nucleotidyl transferase AbiEii/AbiGii toxin family protein [Bacteroidales bacterium]|nr:nucleotidyl transferase AbiEii/AbiGii toxin family protein [Bacteroidales bacterium]